MGPEGSTSDGWPALTQPPPSPDAHPGACGRHSSGVMVLLLVPLTSCHWHLGEASRRAQNAIYCASILQTYKQCRSRNVRGRSVCTQWHRPRNGPKENDRLDLIRLYIKCSHTRLDVCQRPRKIEKSRTRCAFATRGTRYVRWERHDPKIPPL